MADMEFAVAQRRKQPITFTLAGDDHEYMFTPPKTAVMLLPIIQSAEETQAGMLRASFEWLGDGLSEEDNLRIVARLKDDEDGFDIEDLGKVSQGLSEKVAARPTT